MLRLNVIGLDQAINDLKQSAESVRKETVAELENAAKLYVRNAKRSAPVDFGVLKNAISYYRQAAYTFIVVSGAEYSAYVEWGTIEHVSVPEGQTEYALMFKGKGIRKSGGVYPRPFFFVQIPYVQKSLTESLKNILKSIK